MALSMDMARGVLYGVAVGDALGATLEFMSREEIARSYGVLRDMRGGGWLHLRPGEVTDDTEMTLAVAEGIVASPDAPIEAVGRRFFDWLDTNPPDVGITCASALNYARRKGWSGAAHYAHQHLNGRSAGNGSLMRTAYPALWYSGRERAIAIARSISEMTHYDQLAGEACALYTAAIWDIVRAGVPAHQAIKSTFTGTRYQDALEAKAPLNPSGYVVDTLKCALDSIMRTDSFEEAIVTAVNLGGDSDTIGAIAGGLAGAMYGYEGIPVRWLEALAGDTCLRLDAVALAAVDVG